MFCAVAHCRAVCFPLCTISLSHIHTLTHWCLSQWAEEGLHNIERKVSPTNMNTASNQQNKENITKLAHGYWWCHNIRKSENYILFHETEVICWCASIRAGLCCPGCRGWKQKESSWRSPAGWLTQPSSGHLPDTVSGLCSNMLQPTSVCLFSLLNVFSSSALSVSLCLFQPFHLFSPLLFHDISVSLSFLDAEVQYMNMTALTTGHLLSSFWVVDRSHFYIGSASMDWRSLATVSKQKNKKIINKTQHITEYIYA